MSKKISLFFLLVVTFNSQANPISQAQVTKDVTFLASDQLAGRASFTTGSENAADYISKRFSEIGLSPLAGNKSFKQTFPLYQVKVDNVKVVINGQHLPEADSLLFSSHEQLDWKNKHDIKVRFIKSSDNFSELMSQFNQIENDLIVIADRSHAETFNRYKNYFSKAQYKLNINKGPSALIVLSPITQIKSLSVQSVSSIKTQSITNIVGVLPGSGKSTETVLFSAHYDHLGLNEDSNELDKIYNGADDDASGTSAVINLAQHFAQKKVNQRSLIFIAFAAEELGGYGSKYFSQNIDPKQIIAMLNIEMIGKPSKFGSGKLWMTGYERSDLAMILNRNLKDKQIHKDPYPKQQLFYRSDNATLARLGVPAHSFSSTQIDNDQHYHKVTDDISTLDLGSMTQVIQSIADSVESIVSGKDTPTRIDTSNVKKKGSFF